MYSTSRFVTIEKNCHEAIGWTIQQLSKAGLEVNRTFDLQEARVSHPDCPCPHHGSEICNCQINVLLVYQRAQPPASLLLHSFQETTWLYLVDTPAQPVSQDLVFLIHKVLTQPVPVVNKE
jgi:hypothetical protein